jgi:hypothetical protein
MRHQVNQSLLWNQAFEALLSKTTTKVLEKGFEDFKKHFFEEITNFTLKAKQDSSKIKHPKPQSFRFKKHFSSSVKASITVLMNGLKKDGLINSSTNIAVFRSAFSGEEVKVKIDWTGTTAQLHYFIDKLFPCLENEENLKWVTCSNCFSIDGHKPIDSRKLGKAKIKEVKQDKRSILNTLCDRILSRVKE